MSCYIPVPGVTNNKKILPNSRSVTEVMTRFRKYYIFMCVGGHQEVDYNGTRLWDMG
ncbi:hypothetical protein GDO81_023949 [Engystomops pustulosus]|uniref:Uncharacterized protein n=1 Tax=Engystomops pustulosus TaxID=76066 RepID=A0AAV6ZR19_ENGPU|nr:hypothetical protein GDO81_023949 [Engystomops pustulosus]